MDNGFNWATWIQTIAAVMALLLAVLMPSIQKAAERRNNQVAMIRTFRLALAEVVQHVKIMETVLMHRLGDNQYVAYASAKTVDGVIGELDFLVQSQFRLMNSVNAIDLPDPKMATFPALFERSIVLLRTSVTNEARLGRPLDSVLTKYTQRGKAIEEALNDSLQLLDEIERAVEPHPIVKIWKMVVHRIKNFN